MINWKLHDDIPANAGRRYILPLLFAGMLLLSLASCRKDRFADYSLSLFEEQSGYFPFRIDTVYAVNYGGNPIAVPYYSLDDEYLDLMKGLYVAFYRDGMMVHRSVIQGQASSFVYILEPLQPGTYSYTMAIQDDTGNRSKFSEAKPLFVQ